MFGQAPAGKGVESRASAAAAPRETGMSWKGVTVVGLVAAAVERLLL